MSYRSKMTIGLRSEACSLCFGRGWYRYGGLGKENCQCEKIEISEKEWVALGRPKTMQEYFRGRKESQMQ